MGEPAVAVVTVGSTDSSTVFVRLPAALADLESAASSEDELRYALQRGAEAAPPDSRWHVSVDGPALVGVMELQGTVHDKKLEDPTDDQRMKVVHTLTRELTHLGYDVNPIRGTGESEAAFMDDFVKRMS